MLLLNQEDIRQCIDLGGAINTLRDLYRRTSGAPFYSDVPVRSIIKNQAQTGFSLFMPAFIPQIDALGIKISSYYASNARRGVSCINGITVLIDPESGVPIAIIENSDLTSLRTAALSALATDVLVKNQKVKHGVIGAGSQAYAQIRAVLAVRDVSEVKIFSRTLEKARRLAEKVQEEFCIPATCVSNMRQALQDADVVSVATSYSGTDPLLTLRDLPSTVHINAIGGSTVEACEIDPSALASALIIVDDKKSAMRESGEISRVILENVVDASAIHSLDELVQNADIAGKNGAPLSYFRAVGHASQDLAIANFLYRRAVELSLGINCRYFGNKDKVKF